MRSAPSTRPPGPISATARLSTRCCLLVWIIATAGLVKKRQIVSHPLLCPRGRHHSKLSHPSPPVHRPRYYIASYVHAHQTPPSAWCSSAHAALLLTVVSWACSPPQTHARLSRRPTNRHARRLVAVGALPGNGRGTRQIRCSSRGLSPTTGQPVGSYSWRSSPLHAKGSLTSLACGRRGRIINYTLNV